MAAPTYPAWVTRWVSGQWRQKKRPPVIRPTRPLVLANKVANRREQAGEATCITEMSVMMACWKQNDFSNAACAEEIRMFHDCVAKAEFLISKVSALVKQYKTLLLSTLNNSPNEGVYILELYRQQKERREKAEEETLELRGNLTSSKVNRILRRFPNITRYV